MRDSYVFYVDKLEGEYRETFQGIEAYIIGISGDDDTKEEKMSTLLDLFLNAQEDGKPVQKLVGKNVKNFCDIYFADITWKNWIIEFADTVKTLAWFLFVLGMIDLAIAFLSVGIGDLSAFSEELGEDDIGSLIIIFMSSYIISRITASAARQLLFKMKKISYRAMWWIQILIGLMITVLVLLLAFHFASEVRIPIWVEVMGSAIYLILYYILNRKRVAERKKGKIKMSDQIEAQIEEQYPAVMMDTFRSKNKWRRKFHRPELTMEEYKQLVKKNNEKNKKYRFCIFYVFTAVIVVAITIGMAVTGQFESLFDGICFFFVLTIVEYAIMIPMGRFSKKNTERVDFWLQNWEQENDE